MMTGATEPTEPDRSVGATPGHLLALIRSRPVWTRQQLLDATGMSRPTLLDRLLPLFQAGLIHETGATAPRGGRPAQLIRFDDRHLVVLTFDVGHTHGRVSVAGVDGRELRSMTCRLEITCDDPDEVIKQLFTLADQLKPGRGQERLIGIGMGMPGTISPRTGRLKRTGLMRAWADHPVSERLRDRWDVPLALENDARALALGEATRHAGKTLLGVKWASGIGAGLVVDGGILAGDDGVAGDIGHIGVSTGGPVCRCGRRGCLAAYASGYALLNQLRDHGVDGLDEVARRSRDGDPEVRRLLEGAARRVGTVLAALIAMVNPRTLVLGGIIGELPEIVAQVTATVHKITLSHSTNALRIVPSQLGVRAATVGLVHLVGEQVLAPAAVDRALAGGWDPGR